MKSFLAILTLIVAVLGIRWWPDSPWGGRTICRLSRVDADFNAIGSSLKTYRLNAGLYPSTEQGLAALVEEPVKDPFPRRWIKIADRIPTDAWNNEYQYRLLPEDDPRGFELRSAGKDRKFGTKDDLSSLDPNQ